jgi:hypothetical protein
VPEPVYGEIEPYDPDLPAQDQVSRAIREAAALSRYPHGVPPSGGSSVHVHYHAAPPQAPPAEKEAGPLDKHGQWVILGFVGIPLAAGAVAIVLGAVAAVVFLAMALFGTVVAGFQAMAGSVLALGIVAVLGIAAWKAPSNREKD